MEDQLTQAQINAVYLRCNSMHFQQLLNYCLNPNSGITVEGLREVGYKKINELEQAFNEQAKEKIWQACQGTINGLKGYIEKIEQGSISDTYLQDAKHRLVQLAKAKIQEEWRDLSDTTDMDAVAEFVTRWTSLESFISRRGSSLGSEELKEAQSKMEGIANQAIAGDFARIEAQDDDHQRVAEINAFIQKYKDNTTSTARDYVAKADELMDQARENILAREDWFAAKVQDSIEAYVEFIEKHPSCRYREEADRRVQDLKGNLLTDIKRAPFNYGRVEMYKYISTKTLTYDDLVTGSRLLTDKGYHHILNHPTLKSEQRELPTSSLDNPCSQPGNTDVYFFGIPGSGKTCVLASLMNLTGQLGFDFDPRGPGGGGQYAVELQNYARSSLLPPKTDDKYIQVIDCQIEKKDKKGRTYIHNFSIIEMGGEKTRDFALRENITTFEDLGPGAASLLENDNNKVIFFVIDPTNEKYVVMDDGSTQLIKQDNVLNCVASLLAKNEQLMKKISAIHIILTKADTLGSHVDAEVIKARLAQQGYQAVMARIRKLCQTYNINKATGFQVGLFPFSIGAFMPGELYTFDGKDAKKVLTMIQENIAPTRETTWIDSLRDWFNS